ncbi:Endosulphine [Corchorus olitorius]|uniref:Endosulphine n=1 Tax=Corchorus olitorius TaxID=93759 RepID=A0A1R3IIT8_9ROSI|nr:Endosulphine [Corchorus olitorius]
MSETSSVEDVKEKVVLDHDSEKKDQFDDDDDKDNKDQIFGEEVKDSDENEKGSMPSAQQEEEAIKKKYGGLLPRKPPLISKDHERAFFDSADWALGKQGAQKPKGPLEALRPKLQPTPHQRSRRSAYAPADDTEVDHEHDQSCSLDKDGNDSIANEDHDKDKS